MHPVSDEFLAALAQRRQDPVSRIEIRENGVVVASTDIGAGQWLPNDSAAVSVTRRADVRTEFNASFIDVSGELNPTEASDLLDPLAGREVRVLRGLILADGTAEYVPTAVCAIDRATVTDGPGGLVISITGGDRAKTLARNRWWSTTTFPKGTPGNELITDVLESRFPNLTFTPNLSASDFVLPGPVTFGDDSSSNPFQDLARVALSDGCEFYFDGGGNPVKKPIPNALESPVVHRFVPGPTNLRLFGASRVIDGDTVRNGVIVRGNAPWLTHPISGSAWDTDPGSPTFFDPANPTASPIGPRPVEIEDAYVGSNAQCEAIAAAALQDHLGIEETFDWEFVPHAALEAGDVVEVESEALGGAWRFIIESQQLGLLVSDTDSASSRRRRVR